MGIFYNNGSDYAWIVLYISIIIAAVGGVLVYLLLMPKKNGKILSTRTMRWIYNFLHFRVFLIDKLLKLVYVLLAMFLAVFGVLSLFGERGGVVFLATAVGMNIILRIGFELIMKFLKLVENTTVMRISLSDDDGGHEEMLFDPIEAEKNSEINEEDFE